MFKLVIIGMLVAVTSAGIIGDYGHGGGLILSHASPVVHAAPIVHAAPAYVHAAPIAVKHSVATSYANSNSLSLNPAAVVTAHAAPVAVHAAPVAVHAAPILLGHGGYYGHH